MAVAEAEPAQQFAFNFDDYDKMEEGPASEAFVGTITFDDTKVEDSGEIRWHFGVKPLSFAIKGESGAFQCWVSNSNSKRSKAGIIKKGFVDVFGADLPGGGAGKLKGLTAWWVRKDVEFGTRSDGTPMIGKGLLIPVKPASKADIEAAQARLNSKTNGAPATNEVVKSAEFNDEDVLILQDYLAGKTPADAKRLVVRDKGIPSPIKHAILNGTGPRFMIDKGYMALEDGEYTALA